MSSRSRPTSLTISISDNPQSVAKTISIPPPGLTLPDSQDSPIAFVESEKEPAIQIAPLEPEEPEPDRNTDAPPVPNVNLNTPPDGGLSAWMSVGAVWLISFVTFGTINIWGILQTAFVSDPSSHFVGTSVGKIGFVGGCAGGFTFAVGPFSNIMVSRLGMHATITVGVVLVSLSLMLASISTQFWQLLLSQGIMFGIGASLAYIPAIGLPSQWFARRRSLATGIASSGSGFGGVVLSPVSQTLINRAGIPWTLRFLGFVALVMGLGGVALVRQRVVSRKNTQYKAMDWTVFKVPGYPMFLAFVFSQFFGYATPLFFIPGYCAAVGITASQASGVVSVTTGLQIIGRVLSGTMADLIGPINVLMLFTFMMGLMCIVIWYFATNLGVMMVFAIFYGLFAGAYWALSVPASVKIVGIERLGTAVALQFLAVVVPPIFTVPIGSKIVTDTVMNDHVNPNSREAYRYLIVWSTLISIVAAAWLIPVRLNFSKKLMAKV